MRATLAILITAVSVSVHAEGWGRFSGYNASKENITLAPDYSDAKPRNQNVADIHSFVYVDMDHKGAYKFEIKDTCHQYTNSTQDDPDIWCDGNKQSPLYGVTYRWVKTIEGPRNRDYSDKQIWQCISGCNPRAPMRMVYDF
jgi:hypothetical protein